MWSLGYSLGNFSDFFCYYSIVVANSDPGLLLPKSMMIIVKHIPDLTDNAVSCNFFYCINICQIPYPGLLNWPTCRFTERICSEEDKQSYSQ